MRQATEQMHDILQEFKGNSLRGIMHCFPEGQEFANYVINYGLLIGIGGPVTYPKNVELRKTVAHIPLEKLVLETDAPFLPPQSMRGKQNHPQFLPEIANKITEIKGVSFETVAQTTTKNALNLFGI
jgi:TatD DNase family protein